MTIMTNSLRRGVLAAIRDSGTITWRNLLTIKRNPDELFGAVVNPIVFVLLFSFVFAGSLGGSQYRHFLIAGLFVETVASNSAFTTLGLANDLTKGMIERFRSLPMSYAAVVIGRTVSDLVVSAVTLVIMTIAGLIVGWRIDGNVSSTILSYLLLLLFAFAMSWVGAWVGLLSPGVQMAQSAGLIWLFPISFVSNVFVSAQTLPTPLRQFAEWNPVSSVAQAVREFFSNPIEPPHAPVPAGWPIHHAILYSLLSCLALIAIFGPLAFSRYRQIARR